MQYPCINKIPKKSYRIESAHIETDCIISNCNVEDINYIWININALIENI